MAQVEPFGRAFRKKHFLYDDDYIPLNHGSFGTYPQVVRDELQRLDARAEAVPDTFIRHEYHEAIEKSRDATAQLLHVEPSTLVFVPNASIAVNTVLRSIVWQQKDVIVTFETIYSGFDKTVEYIVESTPAETESVVVSWPCEDDDLVTAFVKTISQIRESGRNPRLAIFDTVSSLPGLRVPYEQLTQTSRELGVKSFLDGAQGIGQIEIDLGATQPDFFTTNLHKWLFVPRGCAILYVPQGNQQLIRSSIPTSHGFKMQPREGRRNINNPFAPSKLSPFQELFSFVGTTNNNAYLTVPAAIEFRKTIYGGEKNIITYHTNLAKTGGDNAAQILGTEVMDNISGTARQCAFANVRLPLQFGAKQGQIPLEDLGKVKQFIEYESVLAKTFFPLIWYNNAYWWRISATIMLEEADIIWGAEKMKQLSERAMKGEYTASISH